MANKYPLVVTSGQNEQIQSADTLVYPSAAYKMKANNTNAVADVTDEPFKQLADAAYAGTPAWTFATAAPSGATNHRERGSQHGNVFHGYIILNYVTNGTSCTAVVVPLPSTWPTPANPGSLGGAADEIIYGATGYMSTTKTTSPSAAAVAYLKKDAANTGYEIRVAAGSNSYRMMWVSIWYFV